MSTTAIPNEEKEIDGNRGSLKRSRADFEDHQSTDDGSESNGFDDSEEEEWWSDHESRVPDDEQDIEEHEYIISGGPARTVKIRLFWSDEEMNQHQSRWMKNFVAECTCDGDSVATALARYISREDMRSKFWERMEEVSSEMCGVAFQVFDRYGTVKTKYMGHPVQKGTGVWGEELDHGPLFLIEQLHVAALELRRKGLGQKIVSLLLSKAQQFCLSEKRNVKRAELFWGSPEAFERAWTLHALVSPGVLRADIESQLVGQSAEDRLAIRTRAQAATIRFWRACGFRRIGASGWFAFSFDSKHQSRALAAASDFDPRRNDAEDLEDEELYEATALTEVKKLKMESLRNSLPLHHAALTLPDDDLKAFFELHADDKIGWDRVTNSEATLLHLTACELKPLSTRWLLENVQHADSWQSARDISGYTPLESLQEKLEIMRTQRHVGLMVLNVSDHFRGYPGTVVSCLSLLSRRDASAPNDRCLRYGCTCGECLEGFLSARMKSSLIFQGGTKYDLLQRGIDDGDFWTKYKGHCLVHLDPGVRKNLKTNESLRKGFVDLFRIAVECLEANRVPTVENLVWCWDNQSEWPSHTMNYLQHAGTQRGCRAVLRFMFDAAQEEDEKTGNRECQLALKEKWSDLPACRNDHEFEFVARACGYGEEGLISSYW